MSNKKDVAKVTTENIIQDIMDETKYSKKEIKEILAAQKGSVAKHIASGEAVQHTGFFIMTPQYRPSRQANNIVTKKKETIPESVGVSIKAGSDIKHAAATLDPTKWRTKK